MRALLLAFAVLFALPAFAQKATTDPNKPKPVTRPAESGVYDITIRVPDETKAASEENKWLAGNTKDVVLTNVTVDVTKHCRIFSYQGKPVTLDEEDLVVVSITKK